MPSKILITGVDHSDPTQYLLYTRIAKTLADQGVEVIITSEDNEIKATETIKRNSKKTAAFLHLLDYTGLLNKSFDPLSLDAKPIELIKGASIDVASGTITIPELVEADFTKKLIAFKNEYAEEYQNAMSFFPPKSVTELDIKLITQIAISLETDFKTASIFISQSRNEFFDLIESLQLKTFPIEKKVDFSQYHYKIKSDNLEEHQEYFKQFSLLEEKRIDQMAATIYKFYTEAQSGKSQAIVTNQIGFNHSRRLQAKLLNMGIPQDDITCLALKTAPLKRFPETFQALSSGLPCDEKLGTAQTPIQIIESKSDFSTVPYRLHPIKATSDEIEQVAQKFIESIEPKLQIKGMTIPASAVNREMRAELGLNKKRITEGSAGNLQLRIDYAQTLEPQPIILRDSNRNNTIIVFYDKKLEAEMKKTVDEIKATKPQNPDKSPQSTDEFSKLNAASSLERL